MKLIPVFESAAALTKQEMALLTDIIKYPNMHSRSGMISGEEYEKEANSLEEKGYIFQRLNNYGEPYGYFATAKAKKEFAVEPEYNLKGDKIAAKEFFGKAHRVVAWFFNEGSPTSPIQIDYLKTQLQKAGFSDTVLKKITTDALKDIEAKYNFAGPIGLMKLLK